MTKKKGLLPIVKQEVRDVILAEIKQETLEDYVSRQLNNIKEDNPTIASFIDNFDKISQKKLIHARYIGVIIYRLLESQAEAEKLEREIHYSDINTE
jgi:hypothetical protein